MQQIMSRWYERLWSIALYIPARSRRASKPLNWLATGLVALSLFPGTQVIAQKSYLPAGNRILMGAYVDRDWSDANPCGDKITNEWEWSDNKQWYGNAYPYFGKIFPEVFRPDGSKNWYGNWEAEIDRIKAQGRVPYINLEFHGELAKHNNSECWHGGGKGNDRIPRNIIAQILNGQHNDIIDNVAHGLKAEKVPVFIDLFHEANGDWYDWSPCKHPGETWERFRSAFKYVVNRFRAVGADNVVFAHSIWAVSHGCRGTSAGDPGIGDIYIPGYMEWMGIDVYSGNPNDSFAAAMSHWYGALASTGRPLVIGEMGVVSEAGKAQWMTDFRNDLIDKFPAVKAFNWFDINKAGEANWRIDGAGTGPHFASLMKDSHFVGSFGTYEIKNKSSNLCLDVSGASGANGANVQVYACNKSNAQTFTLADLTAYKMEVRALHSDKCVDVAAAGTVDGTNVQQYTCNATAAQTWKMNIINHSPLEVEFVADHSGKCLDVDFGIGPNVQQWWCTGSNAQRFILIKR